MSGWWTAAFVAQWVLLLVLSSSWSHWRARWARSISGWAHAALSIDTEGPALGEALPPVDALDGDGAPLVLGGAGARRLVLFSSPTCMVCREVAPALPAAARAGDLVPQVVHDPDAERVFEVPGTPFLLVLDELGSSGRRAP